MLRLLKKIDGFRNSFARRSVEAALPARSIVGAYPPAPPEISYNHGDRPYLTEGLSQEERERLFHFNAEKVNSLFLGEHRDALTSTGHCLWRSNYDENSYRIRLMSSPWQPWEGELSLLFECNDRLLYIFAFNFAPGAMFGVSETSVILLTRMQGKGGAYDEMRQSAKDMQDIAPQSVVMAVLGGVAQAAGVEKLVALGGERQLSYHETRHDLFLRAYDNFLLACGAEGPVQGLYFAPVPLPRKPLLETKRFHRSRAKARQTFKARIAESAATTLEGILSTSQGRT